MSVSGAIATTKVGRNDPCPCGSGRKFKHCCEAKDPRAESFAAADEVSSERRIARQRLQDACLAARKQWEAGNWAEANSLYQEIVRLSPNSPQAHNDLGVTYMQIGQMADAAESLKRALVLRPGLISALLQLANCLEQEGRDTEALPVYHKLSRAADSAIERRHYAAKALAIEGKREEAENELRRLLAAAPHFASARVFLGWLLLDRGLFDEAAQQLTQALDAMPGAFLPLSTVKRMTEADRPLVDRVRVLAGRPGLDIMARANIHFGLGKAFDDLGDYAEAMRHYETGNRLRASTARPDRAALASMCDRTIAGFTAEALARARQSLARSECPGDDLPVLIVGMPRSGTTLIEQILSSHPAVAAGGELKFWRDRFGSRQFDVIEEGALLKAAQDYRALLREIGPESLRVTDKAPGNFEWLGVIRLALPDARIIHCRRHALDTCLSIFFANFIGRHDFAWDRGDVAFSYRQYERLMDHWRSVLPADRFTEVQYETLIADPEAETRRLIAFCGLEWDDACLAPEQNTRVVRTASLWQARQPVYKGSVERWRRYEPWLGELRELMPAAETTDEAE